MADNAKISGLVTILIALILSIGAIIVSGIDFQVLNVNWNNSPWRHLGVLQLVSTIYAAVISIFGIIIFTALSDKKLLVIIVN
jgi:hypothetical protein